MIRFVQFHAPHLAMFQLQEAQRASVKFGDVRQALELERDGVGWTGVDAAGVVGCAGFLPTAHGLGCWAAFSDRIGQHGRPVLAFIRQRLALRAERQICALVAHDFPKAARFAQALGFEVVQSPAIEQPGHDLYRFKRG